VSILTLSAGEANGGSRPEWPHFDPASRNALNFSNQGVMFGSDPLEARLGLWRSVSDQAR
jgi:para-nitrobenzyl esterase